MEYTISMCHSKVFRRFKHGWSEIYYQSLQEANGFTFQSIQMPEEVSRTQYNNDHDLLTAIANIDKSHPGWALPRLIPNLISMSLTLPIRGSPLSLYTSDTYTEFHSFLCLLLKQFRIFIEDLQNLTKPQLGQSDEPPNIRQLVGKIFVLGYALWKMAGGYAFEVHMRNIEHLLPNPRSLLSRMSSNLTPVSDREVDLDDELEATLSSLANGSPASLWMAYRNWVLLMVVHFEAASILRQFIRSPHFNHRPISMKVMVGKRVSKEFMPLDEYFKSEYFPGDTATKDLIANFVAKALALKKQCIFAVRALDTWEKMLATEHQETRRQFCDAFSKSVTDAVGGDSFNHHTIFLQDIKTLIQEWCVQNSNAKDPKLPTTSTDQDCPKKHVNREELVDEISQKLKAVVESLDEDLLEYGAIADIQANFSGALHCEASLASLLDPQTRGRLAGNKDLQTLLDHTKVGHL